MALPSSKEDRGKTDDGYQTSRTERTCKEVRTNLKDLS